MARVLIAMDSFKDSMSSIDICNQIKISWNCCRPNDFVDLCPIADGGEGTTEVLVTNLNGYIENVESVDPLGRKIHAPLGWIPSRDDDTDSNKTAVIEVASASGLELLAEDERNPLLTSSFGTGLLILDAVEKGAKNIFVCLGGSATNDCGLGLLHALGAGFFDSSGEPLSTIGKNLINVEKIDLNSIDSRLKFINFSIITDVSNKLLGELGATKVFGPQKGASNEALQVLESGMAHFCHQLMLQHQLDLDTYVGGGAAGGIGALVQAVLKGRRHSGIDFILNQCDFDRRLKMADLVITGEGCIDDQSAMGKAPYGVALRAKQWGKPVIAICGENRLDRTQQLNMGFSDIQALNQIAGSKKKSMENTSYWLNQLIIKMTQSL